MKLKKPLTRFSQKNSPEKFARGSAGIWLMDELRTAIQEVEKSGLCARKVVRGLVGWSKASVFKTSRIYKYTERNGGFKDKVDEECVCINLKRAFTCKISALSWLLACRKWMGEPCIYRQNWVEVSELKMIKFKLKKHWPHLPMLVILFPHACQCIKCISWPAFIGTHLNAPCL